MTLYLFYSTSYFLNLIAKLSVYVKQLLNTTQIVFYIEIITQKWYALEFALTKLRFRSAVSAGETLYTSNADHYKGFKISRFGVENTFWQVIQHPGRTKIRSNRTVLNVRSSRVYLWYVIIWRISLVGLTSWDSLEGVFVASNLIKMLQACLRW